MPLSCRELNNSSATTSTSTYSLQLNGRWWPYTSTSNAVTYTVGTYSCWPTEGWVDLGHIDDSGVTPTEAATFGQWQRESERRERDDARCRQITAAKDRALELLLSCLTDEQRASYEADLTFIVAGSHGGRYRIHRGSMGNVEWLTDNGERGGLLCAHPDMTHGHLPDADVALAQMMALTSDEAAFVRVANVHTGHRPHVHELAAVS